MTQSLEDYLEMVSFLADEGNVRITDIARRLGFTKPSVHSAIKTLEKQGLVEHKRYSTISLTEKGQALALEIRERHHLIKSYLTGILELDAEIAEKDACKMEHILSKETLESMRGALERAALSGRPAADKAES